MNLLELAARCEKATGPDRELDAWIWVQSGLLAVSCPETTAKGPAVAVGYYSGRDPSIPLDELTMADVTPAYGCPEFTASLDAAMTLVPEGWVFVRLERERAFPGESRQWDFWAVMMEPHGPGYSKVSAETPALALCAAALRARAINGGSDGR